MTTITYRRFTLRIDLDTGRGEVEQGRKCAPAMWNGHTLTCPAIPAPARSKFEQKIICGEGQ